MHKEFPDMDRGGQLSPSAEGGHCLDIARAFLASIALNVGAEVVTSRQVTFLSPCGEEQVKVRAGTRPQKHLHLRSQPALI